MIQTVQSNLAVGADDPKHDEAIAKIRDVTKDWVATYRKGGNYTGRPSYGCAHRAWPRTSQTHTLQPRQQHRRPWQWPGATDCRHAERQESSGAAVTSSFVRPDARRRVSGSSQPWVLASQPHSLTKRACRSTYTALNALAGHYNNFGPTAPVPKKRLDRINKVACHPSASMWLQARPLCT